MLQRVLPQGNLACEREADILRGCEGEREGDLPLERAALAGWDLKWIVVGTMARRSACGAVAVVHLGHQGAHLGDRHRLIVHRRELVIKPAAMGPGSATQRWRVRWDILSLVAETLLLLVG